MNHRSGARDGVVNEQLELTYLCARSEPQWELVTHGGVDAMDRSDLWTPYETSRRFGSEARVLT